MKNILLFVALLPILVFGQEPLHANYDWSKSPKKFTVTDEEKAKDQIVLFEKRSIEYFSKNDELKEYNLVHRIVQLNTDKGIESFNKLYISRGSTEKQLILKARAIKPTGEIVEVSEKNIQEQRDDEGNIEAFYFAFEGLEIGSIIEFLQYTQDEPTLSGTRLVVQNSRDKKNVELEVVYPNFLEFQLYSANGLPEFQEDEKDSSRTRMFLNLENLPGIEEEDWSAYDANLQKIYYKLSKNKSSGKGNFYSYVGVAKVIHEDLFLPLTKKEKKLVGSFISKNAKGASTTKEKIRILEEAMKSTIVVVDARFEKSEDITQILSKKVTTDRGMTKLMLNCLREMKVPFELVLTSNRFEEPFNETFQAYMFLQDFLIYVPELKQYLSSEITSRLGMPPYRLIENKGLFISEVMVADFATSMAKIKYIEGPKYQESVDQIDTELTFNDDLNSCKVKLVRSNTGYKAMNTQSIIDFLDDEQTKELQEEYLKYLDEDGVLEDMTFVNDSSKYFGVKPFIGKATVSSQKFIERAGDKILLKAGLLIGPQAEMYNEKKRVLPVDSYYERSYSRTIVINIPEGYEIKNLKDIEFDYKPSETLGFVSTYKLEGNKLIVKVEEWYGSHAYSLEEYDIYEKTINEAADFNKVVLVLQKK